MYYKLSICIPTFNRMKLLENLLYSIKTSINQVEDNIEICISDNGSNDGTDKMVLGWINENNIKIKYHFEKINKGADWNFINVARMGSGEYLWIVGSDDYLLEDSLKLILKKIKTNSDIYLFGRNNVETNNYSRRNIQYFTAEFMKYNFDNKDHIKYYLDNCKGVGGLFSYLSSNIVKRVKWNNNLEEIKRFEKSSYSHSFVLCKIAFSGGSVEVIEKIIINNRVGNDSFQNNGIVNRILIDLLGYKLILDNIQDLLISKINRDKFIKVIFRERPVFRTILYLKHYSTNEEWSKSKKIYLELGASRLIIYFFDFFPFITSIAYSKIIRFFMKVV